jgi:hypothetical protein
MTNYRVRQIDKVMMAAGENTGKVLNTFIEERLSQ